MLNHTVHIGLKNAKKILLILLGLAFLAFLVASSTYLQSLVSSVIEVFERFVRDAPVASRFFFVGLATASVLAGPFSSVPLVPLAIVGWGIGQTLIFIFLGWMIGNTLAYLIGRYAGKPIVLFVVGQERLEHWIATLKPRMKFSFLLLFRFAMPAETGYVFGVLSYDFWKYMLITALAEAPLVFLVVYAGDAFLVTNWFAFGAILLVGALGILLVYRVFVSRLRQSKSE